MSNYIIRGEIEPKQIDFRGSHLDPAHLKAIQKGLSKLHAFEIMAVNIYKYQISDQEDNFNRVIIQAMANEMTHVQDFQIKLYEFDARPSLTRLAMWLVGIFIGSCTRLLGRKYIVKAGIWTERKAVEDYQKILNSVQWDEETRAVIQRNLDDEYHHIETFEKCLAL